MGFKIVYSIWSFSAQRARFHIGTCVRVLMSMQALSCSVNFWAVGALVVFLFACRSPICKKSSVRSPLVTNTDSHTGYKQLYMARWTCYGIYVPSGGKHSKRTVWEMFHEGLTFIKGSSVLYAMIILSSYMLARGLALNSCFNNRFRWKLSSVNALSDETRMLCISLGLDFLG